MDPFLGEIRIFSFTFPPRGWASCSGQLLAINQNQALFSLLGTTYGGDGRVTFALPDFRGRLPLHVGSGFDLGQRGGAEAVTLTQAQYAHEHAVLGQNGPRVGTNPAGAVLASGDHFGVLPIASPLAATAIGTSGGSQPHDNMQPALTVQLCIALVGIFPPRT
jgi:microcystin-dependent protein